MKNSRKGEWNDSGLGDATRGAKGSRWENTRCSQKERGQGVSRTDGRLPEKGVAYSDEPGNETSQQRDLSAFRNHLEQ